MKVPYLDLSAQHQPLRGEILAAMAEVLDSSAFAGGRFVSKFEKEFAAFCGARSSIGVGSGTDALWLAMRGLGIGAGDEVITVANSFIATAEAISFAGATPVFVDVDEKTHNLDPGKLSDVLTPKTRAIIPVHLFGQPADMDPILAFARNHGLAVIEDAAQAHGAEYKGQRVGTLSDATCFSFYPGKNLGALGEGGGVIAKDPKVDERIRMLRDHGQDRKYSHKELGWNCRMDGIQAAVLSLKLRDLDSRNENRRIRAERYDRHFDGCEEITGPFQADYGRHVFHSYVVRVRDRDKVKRSLKEKGIDCGIHYPVPIHLQKAFGHRGYGEGSFPVAERCAKEILSLPIYPELGLEQLDYVAEAIYESVSSVLV